MRSSYSVFTAHCIEFPHERFHEVILGAEELLEALRRVMLLIEMARHPTWSKELPIVGAAYSVFTAHCTDFPNARFHDVNLVAGEDGGGAEAA